ncbi:MAG: hypothetical protein JXA36_00790 [Coriobacteriia bacterium]|nr:hypothetical protein [Coriobacteriia bacterium]
MNDSQVRAVETLAEEYDYGRGRLHAHKVADLSTSLFDQLQWHGLLPDSSLDDRRTLTAASYCHNIGMSPRAQQEAGATSTRLTETVEAGQYAGVTAFDALRTRLSSPLVPPGLNPLSADDRSLLLYTMLWQAWGTPYAVDGEPLANRSTSQVLAGILRVADGLDWRLRMRVRQLQVQKASAWLRILVRTLAPASEEVTEAQKRSDLLAETLGLRLFIQEVLDE